MRVEYYCGGRKRRVTVHRSRQAAAEPAGAGTTGRFLALTADRPPALASHAGGEPEVILTSSIAVGEPTPSELQWLQSRYGFTITREGSHGKVLLTAPPDSTEPERLAVKVAAEVFERGNVALAQPNFVRVLDGLREAEAIGDGRWGFNNPGTPGVVGADVAATAAWTVTTGNSGIRVAVIDDGVQASHPALTGTVVAQADYVEKNPDGTPGSDATPPNHNDFHGTACAGIIAGRDPLMQGLAFAVSLVACRVGSKNLGGWVADDFDVADGIDWCWQQGQADVLSLSWNGGPPDDLRTSSFKRAMTQGRHGKGCAVIAAAGNTGGPVVYPAKLDGVVAVGASNQWDQRKTETSKDHDKPPWASNVGPELALIAPGVAIATIGLIGAVGAGPGGLRSHFSGTSASAPFVSAAAALILSVRDDLKAAEVVEILERSADSPEASHKRNSDVGFGRLNAYSALRLARRWPS